MNQIMLKGRLVHTPEIKQTPNGVTVTNISIAVNRTFAKQGEERQADFFDITAWRGTGEFIAKYFQKGQEIIVIGEMQSRKYVDKEGKNRTAWNVIADKVEFCGSKGEKSADVHRDYTPTGSDDFEEVDMSDSDIPF